MAAEDSGETLGKMGLFALALIAAVVGFLIASSGSHGPGDVAKPANAYTDADERFHVDADSATERTHTFEVGEDAEQVTIARSISFPNGGSWFLYDSQGAREGIIAPQFTGPAFFEPGAVSVEPDPAPGTWEMRVECQGACEYTLGVYRGDVIEAPENSLRDDVDDADELVHATHDEAASQAASFDVPDSADRLGLTFSFYGAAGSFFQIEDPSGQRVTRWDWEAGTLSRQTQYTPVEDPQAGTWSVRYGCSAACEGAWGFTFHDA